MASKYDGVAAKIVELVGGKDNVQALTHCVTRLRFVLKDSSKADKDKLAETEYVIKVIEAGGQLQVVVGNKVDGIYDAILETQGINGGGLVDADGEDAEGNKGVLNTLMGTISGILVPTLGVLTAAGIIKGVVSFLALDNIGVLNPNSGLYMLLYALGDGFFYFLPIMLGFTAARKFKCNEFIGASIGAALVYPAMVNIAATLEPAGQLFGGSAFAMTYYNTFLGIPIVMPGAGYTSSVFPVIIAVYVASKIEKWCKNHIGDNLRGILTPIITLVLTVVLTYIVIGPVLNLIAVCIQVVIEALFNIPVIGGLIAGAIIGGGFGVLVLFGMHWVIIGLALSLIAQNGFDYIMACGGIGPMIGMFQGLAICWACRKNKKVRDLAIPATISQICGVGEPLMYSILIPIKKLFLINILGGCVGGAIIGVLRTKMYMFGGSGLFGIFNYAGGGGVQDIVKYCIGVGVGGIFAIVATLMAYNDEEASRILG
ncbi:MAG: PTS transporter subunit EIIC [Solobacterium sp.]|nr:PTS transporter subunit EIIC [Solobacterium sp.]